jgi:hypothetical protein
MHLDGKRVGAYVTSMLPDAGGVSRIPAGVYDIALFFGNISQADLVAYRCTAASASLMLDVDREVAISGQGTVASSREGYVVRIDDTAPFAHISELDAYLPAARAMRGRYGSGLPPEDVACDIALWPCDAAERERREKAAMDALRHPDFPVLVEPEPSDTPHPRPDPNAQRE